MRFKDTEGGKRVTGSLFGDLVSKYSCSVTVAVIPTQLGVEVTKRKRK